MFLQRRECRICHKILDSCGFFPDIGIKVLMDKSLITIDESNRLVMHDLLQEWVEKLFDKNHPKNLANAVGCGFMKMFVMS
jgi:hypothetical protein